MVLAVAAPLPARLKTNRRTPRAGVVAAQAILDNTSSGAFIPSARVLPAVVAGGNRGAHARRAPAARVRSAEPRIVLAPLETPALRTSVHLAVELIGAAAAAHAPLFLLPGAHVVLAEAAVAAALHAVEVHARVLLAETAPFYGALGAAFARAAVAHAERAARDAHVAARFPTALVCLAGPDIRGPGRSATVGEGADVVFAERLAAHSRGVACFLGTRVVLAAHMFSPAMLVVPEPWIGACASRALVFGAVRNFQDALYASLLSTGMNVTTVARNTIHLVNAFETLLDDASMISAVPVTSKSLLDTPIQPTHVFRAPRRACLPRLRTPGLATLMAATEPALRNARALASPTLMLRTMPEVIYLRIHAPLRHALMRAAVLAPLELAGAAPRDRTLVTLTQLTTPAIPIVSPRRSAPVHLALMLDAQLIMPHTRAEEGASRAPGDIAPVHRAVPGRGGAAIGAPRAAAARVVITVREPVIRVGARRAAAVDGACVAGAVVARTARRDGTAVAAAPPALVRRAVPLRRRR